MNEPDQPSPIDAQLSAPPVHVTETTAQPSSPSAGKMELLQSRGAVLAVLFLVTGVLGVPLLWINRRFSTTERIVWTIIVTLYTAALLAFVGWVLWWAYSRIMG